GRRWKRRERRLRLPQSGGAPRGEGVPGVVASWILPFRSRLFLASRAEEARPLSDDDISYRSPAAIAGFSFASVDLQSIGEGARAAFGIAVIAEGGAASVDRIVKHDAREVGDSSDLVGLDPAGASSRPDARMEEDFGCVDIADAGHDFLIHQEILDGHPASPRPAREVFGVELG